MSVLKKLTLLLCATSLSACASVQVPNGKLNPVYKDVTSIPIETATTEAVLETPLSVKVPVTNISAGGPWFVSLAAIAVSTAATGVSHAKRADEKKAILDSIDDETMYETPGKSYVNSIKNADWINLTEANKVREIKITHPEQLKTVDEETGKKMEGKAHGVYISSFLIGEQFESLTQRFHFRIYNIKNGKPDKKLYDLFLSDVYYPEGTMDEGFENHVLWIDNDNAEIKKAIKVTTKNINEQLQKHLKDPYFEPEQKEEKAVSAPEQ